MYRHFAVSDETQPGKGDFVVFIDEDAINKIEQITSHSGFIKPDTMQPGVMYVAGNVVYGMRTGHCDKNDLLKMLLEAKFIGPQNTCDDETGKVVGCVYNVFLNF